VLTPTQRAAAALRTMATAQGGQGALYEVIAQTHFASLVHQHGEAEARRLFLTEVTGGVIAHFLHEKDPQRAAYVLERVSEWADVDGVPFAGSADAKPYLADLRLASACAPASKLN